MLNAYTIMMIIVVAFSFPMHGNRKGSKKYIVFSCLAMFVLMALRDLTSIGVDSTSSYLHLYQRMPDQSISEIIHSHGFNSGFVLLFKLVSIVFGNDYQILIIIISAFCLLSFAHLTQKYSLSPVTSICAYWGLCFYIFMFDALKQGIAMSVLVFAFDAIIEKKPLKFYVIVIIASLFHAPALVFLPAYLISWIRIPDKLYIPLIALLFLIIYSFRSSIVKLMMGAYQYTELADIYASSNVSFIGGAVIVYLFILGVCYLLRRPNHDNDYVYTTLFKLMIIATILQTFCYYNNIFKRLADYYSYFSIILITFPFDAYDKTDTPQTALLSQPWIKSAGKIVFCTYGMLYFTMYIINASNTYLPFKFFW